MDCFTKMKQWNEGLCASSASNLSLVILRTEGFTVTRYHKDIGSSPSCVQSCTTTHRISFLSSVSVEQTGRAPPATTCIRCSRQMTSKRECLPPSVWTTVQVKLTPLTGKAPLNPISCMPFWHAVWKTKSPMSCWSAPAMH
ncbi:hypothetical protein SDC9_199417 [bioreactor metagenome]|uniref:Uncharacterized protein n=1 Tax=bioreactor metagenome TaxID=1076179 RepID=A0A645IKE7_9ZZZZ